MQRRVAYPSSIAFLRRRLYALALVDELGPLFLLYTLWFVDAGISAAQTSAVFALWAGISVLLEIPSGALADRVDRRKLVAFALVLRALGIATWLIWPQYVGILIGAALWALHGALHSGAWEALIYDELEGCGEPSAYASVMARVGQLSSGGALLGTALAPALMSLGASLSALGWITVALHVIPFALVLSLPRADMSVEDEEDEEQELTYTAWLSTLREGVRVAWEDGVVARTVTIGVVIEALFIIDEYVPILAGVRGASDDLAPWAMTIVCAGVLLSGEIAARRPFIRSTRLGLVLALGTLAMIGALLVEHLWALALVGVGYGAMNLVWVLADARLQATLPSRTRATTTSVRALFSALGSMACFVFVGALSGQIGIARPLAIVLLALFPVAVMIYVWLPAADQSTEARARS